MPIKVLDMFCGMSAFRAAAELISGFSFIGHCDNDPTAVAACRTLHPTKGEYFCNDARAVNTDEIPVSRASPSALPEQEGLSTIHGELSSLSFPEYLKRNTLHISSLRMYPRSARFAKAGFLPRSSVSYLDWGICANGNVLTARLTFPKAESACSLSDILIPDVPEKYYLSREKAEKLFPNSQIISLRESESTTQAEQP